MNLELVNHRAHLAAIDERLQVACKEIAVGIEPLEGTPSVKIALAPIGVLRSRCRPVNQIKVDIVETKPPERRVECAQCVVVTRFGGPYFSGHPQIAAVDTAFGNTAPHAFFILIERCRVDMAESALDGRFHSLNHIGAVGNGPCSKPDGRHLNAIIQFESQHIHVFYE